MNVYRNRLLNVAVALREAKHPKRFKMEDWGGLCGTPHCALGHYAVRRDLQTTFSLNLIGNLRSQGQRWRWEDIICHFGISDGEASSLFGTFGCGDAQNPKEAVRFIEDFVARKWPEDSPVEKLKAKLRESANVD